MFDLTWKKRDDALFGVLLPSLDWELVEKLHLGEGTKTKKLNDISKHTPTLQQSKMNMSKTTLLVEP